MTNAQIDRGQDVAPGELTSDQPDDVVTTAAIFAASPVFLAAIEEYAIGQLRFRESPRFMNKLVSSDIRWRIVGHLLYLAADRERFGAEGGATYGRLLEICTQQRQASPRILKAMLALLQLTGFVTRSEGSDGRSRYYRPTGRMREFVRLWLGYGVRALAVLEPDRSRARVLEDDDATRGFLVSAGREHLEHPLIERLPEFAEVFGTREGSGTALVAILLAHLQGRTAPSRGEIAARYGLSKTQVRNNVLAAAEDGYLTLDADGAARPTERLLALFHHWVSLELAFYARHMQLA